VAKRLDSRYEPGQRPGTWLKMRVNQGQEFVIGGYTPGTRSFDALIFGYYEGDKLLYAARTRAGFTAASRVELFRRFRSLEISECPFANLPEQRAGGAGARASRRKR
jgi:bifunctional non-homologous end joining protein LigD